MSKSHLHPFITYDIFILRTLIFWDIFSIEHSRVCHTRHADVKRQLELSANVN